MTARPVTPICARAVEVGINQLSSFDRAARPREAVRRRHRGVRSTTLQTLPTPPVRARSASRAAGGDDPGSTALLLVQAVEAQVHGAVLDPPAGRTADECGRAIIDLWTRALTPPADQGPPAAESSRAGHR
ncbi:hypothetical protein [Nocardia beijingensis]